MTELIDIQTLASLGQHFVSHEDMDGVKGPVASLQHDLELIKSFLLQKFGSEFSNLLETGLKENVQGKKSAGSALEGLGEGSKINTTQQLRSKPPPLQRFRRVNSRTSDDDGSQENSLTITRQPASSSSSSPANNSTTTVIKSEKFHRNFLSMSSLGGGSSQRLKRLSGSLGGSGAVVKSGRFSGTIGGSVPSKMPALKNISSLIKCKSEPVEELSFGGRKGGVKDVEFNVSEEAYTAVAEAEYDETGDVVNYSYDGETGSYQDDQYYEESMDQEAYQEEEADPEVYDDACPDSLQIFYAIGGDAGMSPASTQRAMNGRRSTTASTGSSKTGIAPRRRSLPAPNMMMINENSGDGSTDPNYLKKCKVCHEEVPSFSLFNHVIGVHYNGEIPTCHICKKTFTYKQGLISHMRYHDAEKYDKECSYCGKKFIRRSDVVIHERRLHTGERPFLCPVPDCKQAFVRRYCLVTHVKTNHGEPFMALIAGRRSATIKSEVDN